MNYSSYKVSLLGLVSVALFCVLGVASVSADESRAALLEERAEDRSSYLSERNEAVTTAREHIYCERLLARGVVDSCSDEGEEEEENEAEGVLGCTDAEALNYNPAATEDDGSCQYPPAPVLGCTDGEAENYNSLATEDDGSCLYPDSPVDSTGSVVISEVMYDLANDGSQGSESGGDNEWVELYNAGDSAVDLNGWSIGDGSSNDVFAEEELLLGEGEFAVITDATTTALFWDLTEVLTVFLNSSISGGLTNGGDVVQIMDAAAGIVDAMSYGNNTEVFDPSAPDVPAGESVGRVDVTVDTDTAVDWAAQAPTPGS